MSAFASQASRQAGDAGETPFAWPADEDPLQIPQGPISQALVRALIGGGRGAGARLSDAGPSRPWVVMAAERERDGEPVGPVCPLSLDVALVALDLLQRGRGVAPVNARTILARKGYRRWGRERHAFETRIVAQIRLLQTLRLLTGEGAEPLLALAARNVARTDFWIRAAPPLADELQSGFCAEIPNAVLRLDHRRNRGADVLAKKLAVAIALTGVSGVFGVADLLMRAGHFPAARRDRRRDRIAERLPAALRRLRSLEIFDIEGLEALERGGGGRLDPLSAHVRVLRRSSARGAPAASVRVPRAIEWDQPDGERVFEAAEILRETQARRGRPRFAPSAQQRALVRMLNARGATREQIAQAIGVSLPTLRAYFAAELRTGSATRP